MGLGGLTGAPGLTGFRSITLIQLDPLPELPPSASAAARLAATAKAVALAAVPGTLPKRWQTDIASTQTHSRRKEITSHPVETGFRITDHSRSLPRTLSFTGIVSDTPTNLDLIFSNTLLQSRALEAKAKLDGWFEKGEPLFCATSLGVFPTVIIKDYSITRNEASGGSIEFSLGLEEIIIGSEAVARALIDDDAIFLGAGPGDNGGTLPMTPA